MVFPHPRYKNDPLNALFYCDHDALCHVIAALPDGVVARMTNMADYRLRSSIFGAIKNERSSSIAGLIEREKNSDPEKDQMVQQAILRTVQKLMEAKRIRVDGEYVVAAP